MARDLLFEIGIEEIPARFMEPALKQLRELTTAALQQAGLAYEDMQVYGTPRRIALLIKRFSRTVRRKARGRRLNRLMARTVLPARRFWVSAAGRALSRTRFFKRKLRVCNMFTP